jgi:cold shock protein
MTNAQSHSKSLERLDFVPVLFGCRTRLLAWRQLCSSWPNCPKGSPHFRSDESLHDRGAFHEILVEPSTREVIEQDEVVLKVGPQRVRVGGSTMALGTVKWFNDAKGYGFISRADDGKDVFVHYSSISGDGFRTLNQGQTVEYEEQQGPKGLFAARVLKVTS